MVAKKMYGDLREKFLDVSLKYNYFINFIPTMVRQLKKTPP